MESINLFIYKKYNSYQQFYDEFDSYCKINKHLVTCTKSKTHPELAYEYKSFQCIYHQNPDKIKTKQTGIRPIQSYNACNCPWELRVSKFDN